MKKALLWIRNKFFSPQFDFRVRLFNVLAMVGILVSLAAAVASPFIDKNPINYIVYLGSSALSAWILWYSSKSGRYQFCYLITIIIIFMIGFPVFFFMSGAYYGTMQYFFIFAVVFTVFMLEGYKAVFVAVAQILLYVGICLYAYHQYIPTENDTSAVFILRTGIFGFVVVSIALGFAIFMHFRLYNAQQKKLDEMNAVLEKANRMKTEFLQDIKHEIRNPLHVITLGTGIINDYLEDKADAETERSVLTSVQNEALRLGRMVNGMVELAVMSKKTTSRKKTNFAVMLHKCADALRLQAEQKQNSLLLEIAPDLPFVYAETEQLERVPINLLQNAINSTQNGDITIKAVVEKSYIAVCVSDTGEGIPSELLPRVFERGVSGKGGKGYGLSMCRTIIEAHGGSIEIESEAGKGTSVTFTIPVYGGQSEGGKND